MSRKPEYRVMAMDKATNEKNNDIGGAWINPEGSISIRLKPFTVLTASPNLIITLWRVGDGIERVGDN